MLLTTNFNINYKVIIYWYRNIKFLLVPFGLCLFTTACLTMEPPFETVVVKNVSNTFVKVIANFTYEEYEAITVESGMERAVFAELMGSTPQLGETFISLTIIYPDNYKLILDRKAVMKVAEWNGKRRRWTLTVR